MRSKRHHSVSKVHNSLPVKAEVDSLYSFPLLNPNPIIEVDASGKMTFFNKAALDASKKLGYSSAAVLLPKDIKKILNHSGRQGLKKGFYREVQLKDKIFGEHIYLTPRLNSARVYLSDITKKVNAEQEMQKLNAELEDKVSQRTKELSQYNRALAMLSFCNKALIYSSTEKKLLKEVCRIIVEVGGYRWAWVGIAEKDKEKSVRPVAQMGSESGYLKSARVTWSEKDPRGRGPIGLAIRTGKVFVGKDFSKNANLAPWRDEAVRRRFGSVVALPLKTGRETFGVLVVYSKNKDAFSKKEIELLYELTEDMAFGINTIKIKLAHREAEAALKANNELLTLSNRALSKQDYLDRLIRYLKKWCGCSYIGIRILKKKEFIPYESYIGYSKEFWESENMLSLKKDQCACVRVIAEKPEPQDTPLMTKGGSFYTNDSLGFIEGLSRKEASRFRGKCMSCGFASIAIIPIRRRKTVLGAIHLAAKEPNKFSEKIISSLEMMAGLVGEALNKFNTQERLRENEERYRDLVVNARSIIMRLDVRGNITFFNEFAQEFFGYGEKDVIGKNPADLIVPKRESTGRDLRRMLDNIVKNPNLYAHNENENIKKSGERVWVSWNNKVIKDRSGKMNGILCIGTDITDIKKKEEQLVESYKHLGIINRKIPLLLELNNYANGLKKKEVSRLVLASAVNMSKATLGFLYSYGKDGKFHLLASAGQTAGNEIKTLKMKDCRHLKSLLREMDKTQRISNSEDESCLRLGQGTEYSLLLPIKRKIDNKLKGFIFLGFKGGAMTDTHEMAFYDVFSMHASAALLGAEVLK